MNLQEFKRTRVTMTVEQYAALYDGDFDTINKETAKMHVYKDGLYLRETLNGFLHNDLGTDSATCADLEVMEEYFWKDYAELFYNPKVKLCKEAEKLLTDLRSSTMILTKYWLNLDNDSKHKNLLSEFYPDEMPEFNELSELIDEWVMRTINK